MKILPVILTAMMLLMPFNNTARADDVQELPLFVVHFETGPNWDEKLPHTYQKGFHAHSANLKRLREQGDIIFGARYNEYGMIFLRAADLASARGVIAADPGVHTGIFTFRVDRLNVFYEWRGK